MWTGTIVQDNTNCECHVPCGRIAYQPELSYAHLSKLNVDKIWQGNPKSGVQKKYITAREVCLVFYIGPI